ncbi:unnamed protein product [Gongylonema pulchrum]|uniref:Nuclear receptor domain-containing protein n=1 Tax=Gongylonema pulchrum TaxID=637853 RepID=A0A183DPJ7_9BILA|nr:unnamed protein product [Gongylonema pulchrum]
MHLRRRWKFKKNDTEARYFLVGTGASIKPELPAPGTRIPERAFRRCRIPASVASGGGDCTGEACNRDCFQIGYVCRGTKDCPVTKFHRNRCQYCRLRKCLTMGMRSESVQAERRPVGSAAAAAASSSEVAAPTMVATTSSACCSLRPEIVRVHSFFKNRFLSLTLLEAPLFVTPLPVYVAHAREGRDGEELKANVGYFCEQQVIELLEQDEKWMTNRAKSGNCVKEGTSKVARNTEMLQSPPVVKQESAFMNGLLAIVRNEVTNAEIKQEVDEKRSFDAGDVMSGSPMSLLRHTSVSPESHLQSVANELHHTSSPLQDKFAGEDEQGAVTTILHAPLSASPFSSGASSSLLEEGTLLNSERAKFDLPVPQPMPSELNIQFICETASRLLFLSVHWIKNFRAINSNPGCLEHLMKMKWCDLFILGLMQCSNQFCLSNMLAAMSTHLSACSRIGQLKLERFEEVNEQIGYLFKLVQRFEELKLSSMEYAYLKLISFTANDLPGSSTEAAVRALHAQALQELYEHILSTGAANCEDSTSENDYASGAAAASTMYTAIERYSHLLLLLPTMRWFKQTILVELFFSGLLGSLSIETVIPFILAMDVLNVFDGTAGSESLPGAQSLVSIFCKND